jgi:hypothetical protein
VGTIIGQDAVVANRLALVNTLCLEDSVRVRNRIFEALALTGSSVEPEQEKVKARLTPNYTLDAKGVPHKKT